MEITAPDIGHVFDQLLAGTLSREAAEAWAGERMRLDDAEQLTFAPPSAERQLRDAIHYLSGVALRVSQSEYLHGEADFHEYRRRRGL